VVLGGTFDPIHKGHESLFEKAFQLGKGDRIIVGLTSDSMAQAERQREVCNFSTRKQKLEKYLLGLQTKFPETEFIIKEIHEVYNKGITQETDAEVLVVSQGTRIIAEKTNQIRQKNAKPPLKIVTVPYVLAFDGLPIKASRIHAGEIDRDGNLLGPVRVAVGTKNEVKVSAVKNIFEKIFDDLEIEKIHVPSGVSEQPWGADTITGAENRAKTAFEKFPGAHFGVGIEAGLFHDKNIDKYYDVQYCVIVDRGGRVSYGHGPGFYYPSEVVNGLKLGKTVGEVMSKVTGIDDIGHKQGAIGYLSKGLLSREGLTEQAVIMAMVPRLSKLYELEMRK
jgi:inosine/xanthosine triphosphatase